MGAGARALLCSRLGFVLHGAARDARSGRVAALGGPARGNGGEGDVRVHGAELFPAAARGYPGRLSAVCEPAGARQEVITRNAEVGTRKDVLNSVPRSAFRLPRWLDRSEPSPPPRPSPLRSPSAT